MMMKSVFIYSSIILFGAVLSAVAFFYSHNYFYLSEDERSALLFSENGFYYSFYNDIVSAKSLSEAYTRLVYDDRSEFGHTINAVQRFNIYQEIVLALVYRAVATVVVDLPSLIAPLTFYMCAVFVLFGCGLAAFVRLARKISVSDLPQARGATSSSSPSSSSTAATNKSKSLSSAAASKWKSSVALFGWLNGLLALTLFLYNWRNVSRVQIHPPLRENFGMPLFFMQFGTLVDLISNHQRNTKTNFKTILNFVFFTTSFLLVWQFAHILLFIECCAIAGLFALSIISKRKIFTILSSQLISLALFLILMFGATPMYSYKSMFFSAALSLIVCCLLFGDVNEGRKGSRALASFIVRIVVFLTLFGALLFAIKRVARLQSGGASSDDDSHIFDVLLVRLGLRHHNDDFQIRIYTTQNEFAPAKLEVYEQLTRGLVLPLSVVGAVLRFLRFSTVRAVDWFLLAMLAAVMSMMAIMMRFQVLASPMLCLVATVWTSSALVDFSARFSEKKSNSSSSSSSKTSVNESSSSSSSPSSSLSSSPSSSSLSFVDALPSFSGRRGQVTLALFVAVIGIVSSLAYGTVRPLWRIESGIVSRGASLPDLCRWARRHVDVERESIVGDMVVTSVIRLCSRAPIVSHPQYESAQLRRRARLSYEFYGHREPKHLFKVAQQLKATYVLINKPHCSSRVGDGSTFLSLVDRDYEAQGNTLASSSLCDTAVNYLDGTLPYFEVARANADFWVLRVREHADSQSYVERALKHDGEAGASLCALADFFEKRGDNGRAAELRAKAIACDSPDATCVSDEAYKYEQRGDYVTARRMYEQSLQLQPNDAELITNYAIFLDETANKNKTQLSLAGNLYRQAIKLGPYHPTYYGNYATYLSLAGDFAAARQYYEIAANFPYCDAASLCGYAVFLGARNPRARELMQRAETQDPNNHCVVRYRSSILK